MNWMGGGKRYIQQQFPTRKKSTQNRKDTAINDRYFLKGSLKKLNNYINDTQNSKTKENR